MELTGEKIKSETPLMQQYNSIKAKYPDALLLFRVGDFYETFNSDAIKASQVLGIVLTKRSNGSASETELAGFPHHSLDVYLPKLVRAGLRVAICDQLEDPKLTKKIVKRGVTELITPGVAFTDKILDHRKNNFLASVYCDNKGNYGAAFTDASTGEFYLAEGNEEYLDKLLQSYNPSEILVPRPRLKDYQHKYGERFYFYSLEDWIFQWEFARETLLNHFNTTSLKGFGVEDHSMAVIAAGASLHYLQQTRQETLSHINALSRIDENRYVWLDRFTIRNLELISSPHEKARTLLDVVDHSLTPMGSRLLKRWLLMPLKDINAIRERHDTVEFLSANSELTAALTFELKQVGDIERIASRIAIRKITPRELVQLGKALQSAEKIIQHTAGLPGSLITFDPCQSLQILLSHALNPDAPAMISKGSVIRDSYSPELDELRNLAGDGKDYLLRIQRKESENTGISSLKIAFNNVFGYYIEVTNSQKHKVPASWTRKQTLANAERYITEELKIYEEKILGAEEKMLALESRLFNELVIAVSTYIPVLQQIASAIAKLDCLLSFSVTALKNNYVRPQLNDDFSLTIKNGRHPVLEQQLPVGDSYIPNDLYLDNEKQQIIMITGPNMSGKSAILRQTALIVLMAQAGSYVPAQHAIIGVVDKIFTRVGASDNISQGESTFMVEMNETASILHNISARSLILLDEIGRGTSTYDGISIAWAIAEYIHEHPSAKAKTLFATHYHELNEMTHKFPRIKNFNIAIRETQNQILFLRKLVPGGSEHSFGIHVAKMAGMPGTIIRKATDILETLEKSHGNGSLSQTMRNKPKPDDFQLSFFQLDDPLLEKIRDEILNTDINSLTPVEALLRLQEIKNLITKDKP